MKRFFKKKKRGGLLKIRPSKKFLVKKILFRNFSILVGHNRLYLRYFLSFYQAKK